MQTSSQGSDSKKRYRRLIGLAIGLALFGLVLCQLGPRQILGALKELDYRYILVACAMFAVSYSIKVSKWYFIQRRAQLSRPLLSIAHLYFGTRVGGLMTPLRSGEFIPGLLGDKKGEILAITLFDRLVESVQTLLTFIVVLAIFAYQFISPSGIWSLALFALFLFLLCLPLLYPQRSVECVQRTLDWVGQQGHLQHIRWFSALRAQAREITERFFEIAARLFSPTTIALSLAATFCGWFFDIMVNLFVFRAVGAGISVLMVMLSMMTLSMINFIAPTPSGLGIGDATLALILGSMGYRGETGAFLIIARPLVAVLTVLGYMLFNWLDT